MSFANKLKKARLEKNLTQRELAEQLECGLGVIGDIERGARNPSKKFAIKLNDFFQSGGEWYWLIEDQYEPKQLFKKHNTIINLIDSFIKADLIDKNGKYSDGVKNTLNEALNKEIMERLKLYDSHNND